jgi:uncharacterized protein (TIGR02145 family)
MPITQLRSEPSGIVSSYYFSYSTIGYTPEDTLRKNKGYWIKVSQAGILIDSTASGTSCPSSVVYEGKTYTTVLIGNQCWMKENLDVGTMVNGNTTQTDNSIIEKYCYNNDPAKCDTFGGLYQWNEAMQYSTTEATQGVCPIGWHIPTVGELFHLGGFANGNSNTLKSIGVGTGDGVGTNGSGFSGLLSGFSNNDGIFYNLWYNYSMWSSSELDATDVNHMGMANSDKVIYMYGNPKNYGFSVRCVKD